MSNHTAETFIQHSISLLTQYREWIRRALENFPEDKLWWQPNPNTNSMGIILKHLRGNLGQWILSGVGGLTFTRNRPQEFTTSSETLPMLKNSLIQTINQAILVLKNTPTDKLLAKVEIQGFNVTVLQAIYHAIEHLAYHTGQIVWLAKLIQNKDFKFYKIGKDGNPKPNW